jgi:hypothetical protein
MIETQLALLTEIAVATIRAIALHIAEHRFDLRTSTTYSCCREVDDAKERLWSAWKTLVSSSASPAPPGKKVKGSSQSRSELAP